MEYICNDCPRQCGAKRTEYIGEGVCLSPYYPLIARAAPHYGEEPCISGTMGSGTVFFSGCNLRCVFCQNYEISNVPKGISADSNSLKEIFLRLQDKGVHNINLVTPSHYTNVIAEALSGLTLDIPVVWNSSGYEKADTIRKLDGLVDIFMPDYKYSDKTLAGKLSRAENYELFAREAISEMYRQVGRYKIDSNGILQSGLLIRHLILPRHTENSMNIIDYVADTYSDNVLFSLMSQYTPLRFFEDEFGRRVSPEENELLIHYMKQRGLTGFCQDPESAVSDMIPDFDLSGL